MSEPKESDKNFLVRWSRRKREAERGAAANTGDTPVPEAEAPRPGEPMAAEPKFDIKSLPPIESIGATTDIRPFLKPGVPVELTRAALRRAWTADPAIRNYIGLSENAWDFNDPTAMAGFGPLDPGDAQRLLASILPQAENNPPPPETATKQVNERQRIAGASNAVSAPAASAESVAAAKTDGGAIAAQAGPKHSTGIESANAAPQQQEPAQPGVFAHLRRGHGGALPE